MPAEQPALNKLPRVCYLDIETSPAIVYSWASSMYEQDIIEIIRHTYILCFSVKWRGDKKVTTYKLPDYKEFKKDIHDDSALVRQLHSVFSEADIIIAHNGIKFDERKSRAAFLKLGLQPPSPHKSIDTLRIARSQFAIPSNRLNDLGVYLGLGAKRETGGFKLWKACTEAGDLKAFNLMGQYCARDVELLEAVFWKLAPFAKNLPDLNCYTAKAACPACQSVDIQHRGFRVAIKRRYERLQCQSCGSWFSGKMAA